MAEKRLRDVSECAQQIAIQLGWPGLGVTDTSGTLEIVVMDSSSRLPSAVEMWLTRAD